MVFNLIPIPPLDGSKIFAQILPYNAKRWIENNYQTIYIVFIALWITGLLSRITSPIVQILYDLITLGVGKEGEPYEGIGRGMINIQGLPVYRDLQGGVGTPTSDHERTKISLDTKHLVVLINGYDGKEERVIENARFIQNLLRKYAQSDGGRFFVYR